MADQTKLTREEVQHIAKLANITVKDSELATFQHQLSDILSYVAKLDEVATEDIVPSYQITGQTNGLREDLVNKEYSLTQQEALQNAPKKQNNLFLVPAILEEE